MCDQAIRRRPIGVALHLRPDQLIRPIPHRVTRKQRRPGLPVPAILRPVPDRNPVDRFARLAIPLLQLEQRRAMAAAPADTHPPLLHHVPGPDLASQGRVSQKPHDSNRDVTTCPPMVPKRRFTKVTRCM